MSESSYYFRDTCRMCDSKLLTKTVSLTPTPPGNDFLTKAELGSYEPVYPLDLYFCEDCHHVQLGHVVNPKILYQKNYTYVSATSPQFVNHLKTYALDMIERFKLKSDDLVADIGSNDGTCLSFFKDEGLKVVGVDPAKEIASKATVAGIETVGDFFSYNLALSLREKYGSAKYITSHNACAHIDNLLDIVKGIKYWLDDDGVFVDGFKKAGGVSVGDIVYNTTALTSASITSIRDNKLMTLSADIFGTPALANDSYRIFANPNGQLGVTSQSSTEACLLYVGSNSTGTVVDVRVKTSAGNDVTFTNVKVGSVLPVQVLQLYSTGTTVESRNNCIAIW